MSTVTDEMVEAAWAIIRSCGAPVGAGDGNTYIPHPPSKADVLRALEAAEAVRAKNKAAWSAAIREANEIAMAQWPCNAPTIPEGFIPWHGIPWRGGECPVASGTVVECMLVNGVINSPIDAINMRWSRIGLSGDIIAYRIHKPADFRLEAGKFYVTASGERVGPMRRSSGAYGSTYHDSDGWGRWWWPNGEIGLLGSCDPDILALSSNQESGHD
jgi:hypothetical protein